MVQKITQKQIQYIRSLHLTKFRRQHNCFLVQGDKLCVETLRNNRAKIHYVCGTANWIQTNQKITRQHECLEVTERELSKISTQKTPNQSVVICEIPSSKISLNTFNENLCFYLDNLRDPGNMGTILRVADWFGLSTLFLSPQSVDIYQPKVVQSSMGSIHRVQATYVDWNALMEYKTPQSHVIGTTLNGVSLSSFIWPKDGLIIIGNESHGVRDDLLSDLTDKVFIQKSSSSQAESLNAAVAAGIVAYSLSSASFDF